MEITVRFPGGKRVDASVGDHVIHTDQPQAGGGEDSAPAPFDLFLASLATCAGIYVLGFCQARNLSTDGIGLVQRHEVDPVTRQLVAVTLELELPSTFPSKYREPVAKAAEGCKVKKLLAHPPAVSVAVCVAADRVA